jgi:hypothetical protein
MNKIGNIFQKYWGVILIAALLIYVFGFRSQTVKNSPPPQTVAPAAVAKADPTPKAEEAKKQKSDEQEKIDYRKISQEITEGVIQGILSIDKPQKPKKVAEEPTNPLNPQFEEMMKRKEVEAVEFMKEEARKNASRFPTPAPTPSNQ